MTGLPLHRIFVPPSLVLRQLGSAVFFASLSGWRRFGSWFLRHGISSLAVAAGARGMGCIGFPDHPVWEVTTRCNLRCVHCHVGSDETATDELSTREGCVLIDRLRAVDSFRMLVYSGGEPLVRGDLFDLLAYSQRRGFANVIATNATLIDRGIARRLKRAGVAGVAVSVDSHDSAVHNAIRNNPRAFERMRAGIEALRSAGIPLQVNITAMEYNFGHLQELLDLAGRDGAGIVLLYQLVAVGRGCAIGSAALDKSQNERLLKFLANAQRRAAAVVEPVAGPQYWPYLLERAGTPWLRRAAEPFFHGCSAGRGFVYIKADGEVWPCPFIEISAGNVRREPFERIWRDSAVFRRLRNRETLLKGFCGDCGYRRICGGCRGRAYALCGDLMAEDPSCFLRSAKSGRPAGAGE